MTDTATTEIGEFFNAWAIYRKVLKNNYMYHREIYLAVGEFLRTRMQGQTFSLLDLGCGDASFITGALQGSAIENYTGFDLSAPALALARENITTALGCAINLVNTDFMDGLVRSPGCFEIVFTSFALHHLNREEKARFFVLAHAALKQNGVLLIIDTMREPEETLPVCVENYCQWVREQWADFDSQEIEAICRHIANNDLPETVAILSEWAEAAGFYPGTGLYQKSWHKALWFAK